LTKGRFTDGPADVNAAPEKKAKFVWVESNTAPPETPDQLASVQAVATQKSSDVETPKISDHVEIEVNHARSTLGNDLTVAVSSAKVIDRVVVELDGQRIGDDSPQGRKYRRHFQMQGSASPGMLHKVSVKVESGGQIESYQDAWTDLN
jgi:hypothetical protein